MHRLICVFVVRIIIFIWHKQVFASLGSITWIWKMNRVEDTFTEPLNCLRVSKETSFIIWTAQSRQNLRCSLIQAVSLEEPSERKPDPWPLWMAGHAQLKFVMTECSKTQIRLTGLIWNRDFLICRYYTNSISLRCFRLHSRGHEWVISSFFYAISRKGSWNASWSKEFKHILCFVYGINVCTKIDVSLVVAGAIVKLIIKIALIISILINDKVAKI